MGSRVWDDLAPCPRACCSHQSASAPDSASPPPSSDTSRPETWTEDDRDVDVDMDHGNRADIHDAWPSPEPPNDPPMLIQYPSRVPVILPLPGNADAITIGDAWGRTGELRVEDGIVLVEPNDDFAMSPPGAPGAITNHGATPRNMELRVVGGGDPDRERNHRALDVTTGAGFTNLPPIAISEGVAVLPGGTIRGVRRAMPNVPRDTAFGAPNATQVAIFGGNPALGFSMNRHHRTGPEMGAPAPYRDEDVLLSLQLLAYLSKYPHVRQAFYKPRVAFHPVTAPPGARGGATSGAAGRCVPGRCGTSVGGGGNSREPFAGSTMLGGESHSFLHAFTSGASRGKEKEKAFFGFITTPTPSASGSPAPIPAPTRQTNLFSLVEQFTFRPSSSEADLPDLAPRLLAEIQFWAGVVMQNACRKDDSRGGIRQCANST